MLDYIYRKVPEYYPTMYLDGFTPEEILMAKHKQMLEQIEGNQTVEKIVVSSEVKVKR